MIDWHHLCYIYVINVQSAVSFLVVACVVNKRLYKNGIITVKIDLSGKLYLTCTIT